MTLPDWLLERAGVKFGVFGEQMIYIAIGSAFWTALSGGIHEQVV